VDVVPEVALVLGSGLGAFADSFERKVAIDYAEIPTMPRSNVEGHAGKLVFGDVAGIHAVAMQGRVHLYEGHSPNDVVFGVRLMLRLGASTLFITNAAGGVADGLAPGDLMLIKDHLNLTGQSCLTGPNESELGVRFPDMSVAYDPSLRRIAGEAATDLGIELRHGTYAGLLGPAYETPSEVRMLGRLGADAIGMSTVLEVLAARHMGARVLGISCITNLAAGITGEKLSHHEVTETATRSRLRFSELLSATIATMAKEGRLAG